MFRTREEAEAVYEQMKKNLVKILEKEDEDDRLAMRVLGKEHKLKDGDLRGK